MNELLGSVWHGMIFDENDKSYFVQKNGITFLLDKSEGEKEIGAMLEGFGYQNQKQQNIFTTKIPSVRKDHQDFAEVIASRKDLGVFVDIGLKDKEIVVSLDELPEMRQLWPKKGDQLLVSLKTDEKDRVWATLAEDVDFLAMSKAGTKEEMHNKNVSGIVYRLKLVGTFFITDERYIGFIHPSERFEEPRLGEKVSGRVIGVRPDGMLNVSLKPRGYEVISSDAQMILTFLERSEEGKIPFSDKSTPESIQETFAISKGQFKRALGSLMKEKMIKQEDGWTVLIKKEEI
ncbi:S1 RNA-binding domain-containing protein [Vagococcus carniphilus]|uniref:CvfB family protein n=1 Tax=Vagococcus carniphilus TaxID=218144 RepID=UPI003BACE870